MDTTFSATDATLQEQLASETDRKKRIQTLHLMCLNAAAWIDQKGLQRTGERTETEQVLHEQK